MNDIMTKDELIIFRKVRMSGKKNFVDGTFPVDPKDCILFGKAYGSEVGINMDEKNTRPLNANQLIIGPVASGKTYNYVLPNLKQGTASAVIHDPYGSLSAPENKNFYENKGIKVHIIDFDDPEHSSRYNPFLYFRRNVCLEKQKQAEIFASHIREIFSSMQKKKKNGISDPYCESAEKNFLSLAILYLIISPDVNTENCSFKGLLKFFQDICAEIKSAEDTSSDGMISVKEFTAVTQKYDYSKGKEYTALFEKAETIKVLKSVVLNIMIDLQIFSTTISNCFEERADTDNIDLNKFGLDQHYLFINTGNNKPRAEVASLIITRIFSDLFGDRQNCETLKTKPRHVQFYLDEFSGLNIPDIFAMTESGSEKGINFSITSLSISLLQQKYGEEWTSVSGSMGAIVFMGVAEYLPAPDLEFLSKLYEGKIDELISRMKANKCESGNDLIAVIDGNSNQYPVILCDKLVP